MAARGDARKQTALKPRVVISISFSRDVTTPFVQAFERVNTGIKVDVQNRSTTAAVAVIRRTRSSPPDLFWASAPDAFEVLKQGNHLAQPAIDTCGIPARIRAQPTYDPEGHHFGFAVSDFVIL